MNINYTSIHITFNRAGECWCDSSGEWKQYQSVELLKNVVKCINSDRCDSDSKIVAFETLSQILELNKEHEEEIKTFCTGCISEEARKDICSKLIEFFKEFEFEPNFRFVNTFAYACATSIDTAKEYVEHYFDLTDSVYKANVKEKIKSYEFEELCKKIKIAPKKKINTRFKLYYGSQGTGKTTSALQESDNVCMVCHSAMLPSDLMEDFKFNDGKAAFTPSALYNAMLNGTVIVLDEINLLPFESLRFLQSILDGKSEFIYKGQTVHIKDGFKIIGTMNLHVNGCVYSLPEPLVDRCEEIKEFRLTADALMSALD